MTHTLTSSQQEDFQKLKRELEPYRKENTLESQTLNNNFACYFVYNHRSASYKMLVMNLLDLQVHFQKEFKTCPFNQFFKKSRSDQAEEDNFPFFLPYFDTTYMANPHGGNLITGYDVRQSVDILVKEVHPKTNLADFLTQYPHLKYYFWNVTFPNIFGGFVSKEYCFLANEFLTGLKEFPDLYVAGIYSFIRHNYSFQEAFLNNFFMEIQHGNVSKDFSRLEASIQKAFQKAARHLSSFQLQLFITLINDYPQKAMKDFLNEIILPSLELWHYSPLFYPNHLLYDEKDSCTFLDYLKNKQSDAEIEAFISPFFESAKQEINETCGEMRLSYVLAESQDYVLLTMLDLLIISKITKNVKFVETYKIFLNSENAFNPRYILTKGFRCTYFEFFLNDVFKQNSDILPDIGTKPRLPELDPFYISRWNEHVEQCKLYDENPLDVIYEKNSFDSELSDDILYAGLIITNFKRKLYEYTENNLKQRVNVLIPFKAFLKAQDNFLHMVSLYWAAQGFSIGVSDFDLEIDFQIYFRFLNNFLCKSTKYAFKTNFHPVKSKIKTAVYYDLIHEDKFNPKFRYGKYRANRLARYYSDLLTRVSNTTYSMIEENIPIYELYYSYLEELTQAQFLCTYKYYKTPINITGNTHYLNDLELSVSNIAAIMPDGEDGTNFSDDIDDDELPMQLINFFDSMEGQGLFEYIYEFIKAIETKKFFSDSSVSLGSIFMAIPVITKMFDQFFVGPKRMMHSMVPLGSPSIITDVFLYVSNKLPTTDSNGNEINHLNIIKGILAKVLEMAIEMESKYKYGSEMRQILENLKSDFDF